MDTIPDPPESLDELVALALTEIEERGLQALEELCARHPAHAPALRSRIARLLEAGLITTQAEAPPAFPERLGDFRLIEVLGRGGMGIVYRAEQLSLAREVALKLVRPEQLWFPGARERFYREVAIVAGLAHPGIVPVHAFGEEDGLPYFAMELVRGATLLDVVDHLRGAGRGVETLHGADLERALAELVPAAEGHGACELFAGSWEEACVRIAREVAEALEHAHRRGVVHRDVKPSNVLLTPGGRVMLVDFGLSSTGGADRLTRSGTAIGSVPYMSPEQVAGMALDARTDVYSLGAALYELLALRLPYEGETALALAEQIQRGDAPPLRGLNPRVSWELATIVATAMEVDAARRYASAADLARDLGHALAHRPIEARPAGRLLRARRWVQRHPARAVAAVAAFLLLVVTPSVIAWREHRAGVEIAAQRALAERNFAKAKQAVDEMLRRVGDEMLADVPLMGKVRQQLIAEAIEFYEGFIAEQPDRPELLLPTAGALHELAELYGRAERWEDVGATLAREGTVLDRLEAERRGDPEIRRRRADVARDTGTMAFLQGRSDEAEELFRQALALLEKLDAEHTAVRWSRARAQRDLARVLYATGRLADGRASLEASIEDWSALAERELIGGLNRDPEDVRAQAAGEVGVTLCRLGMNLRGQAMRATGEQRETLLDEARSSLERSVAVLEKQREEVPGNAHGALNLGRSLDVLANVLVDLGEDEPSMRRRREAVEALRTVVRDHPELVAAAGDLGRVLVNLGGNLAKGEQWREAGACLREATQTLERVVELQPASVDWQAMLAGALLNSGGVLQNDGDLADARAAYERGYAIADRILTARPGDPQATMIVCSSALGAARILLELGDAAPAVDKVRAAMRARPFPHLLGIAAQILADCAAAARQAQSADATELAAWEDEAVQALDAALSSGGTTREKVLADEDMVALRALPAAQALLEGK